jgi:hypothetical protein
VQSRTGKRAQAAHIASVLRNLRREKCYVKHMRKCEPTPMIHKP